MATNEETREKVLDILASKPGEWFNLSYRCRYKDATRTTLEFDNVQVVSTDAK